MIGDLIDDNTTSHLRLLIANDKIVEIVEVNPELFNHVRAKKYTTDPKHNFIEHIRACAQESKLHKCIDLIHNFIKTNHMQKWSKH